MDGRMGLYVRRTCRRRRLKLNELPKPAGRCQNYSSRWALFISQLIRPDKTTAARHLPDAAAASHGYLRPRRDATVTAAQAVTRRV